YRDAQDDVSGLDAKLVGISTQGMESKQAFKAKYGLTTELLADPGGKVSKQYGVYAGPMKMAKRTEFIVDAQGRIAYRHGNFMSLSFDSVQDIKTALDQVRAGATV